MKHLIVLEEQDHFVHLSQDPEQYADPWEFYAKWDGCVNYTQRDPMETIKPGQSVPEPVGTLSHACSVGALIAYLEEVREFGRKKWGDEWDEWDERDQV